MRETSIDYASPKIAKAIDLKTKVKSHSFRVEMRSSQDVPDFLKKLENARNKTRKSVLQFD